MPEKTPTISGLRYHSGEGDIGLTSARLSGSFIPE